MRILALVPGGIGDQILFFPTLETLKTQYPNATIDVIVEPRSKSAYRICPFVHEILLFDFRDRNGLADYLNLLGIMRDREYDMAISTSSDWTISLLLWLNGIPVRVGYQGAGTFFLSNNVSLKSEQYQAFAYHDLLQAIGIKTPCPPIHIALPKADIDWAEMEQKRLGIKDSGYILLYDYSSYPVPQWQAIIEDIQRKQPDLPIVLLDTLESEPWIAQLQESFPALPIVQPSDVGKMAALVAGANLTICPEGDVVQAAVATGTYTIGLFFKLRADKRLPPDGDKFIGLQSPSDRAGDIAAATILRQLWQET